MKLNKLALVCAVACATFAGQASAQLVAGPNLTIVNNAKNASGGPRILYISGASAVQGGFNQITATLLQANPVRFQSPTANDYRAVAGKLVTSAGTWNAGDDVIIINRAKGGSVFGVNPVARNTKIESLNISAAGCLSGSGTVAQPYVCALTTDSTGATATTDDDFIAPDAGVSDVAPSLFDGNFNTEGEPGEPALTASELALLGTPTPIYTLAFGVPMSDNLPLFNINKSALSAVMAGNVGTWNVVNSSLPADDVLICRRVNGSGSQAVANLYYGNYPCDTGSRANAPADRNAGAAWNGVDKFLVEGGTGAVNVVENSTSGDVRSCLNSAFDASAKPFNAGATPGTLDPVARTITGAVGYTGYVSSDRAGNPVAVQFRDGRAHKAVGVLSMDSLANSNNTPIVGSPTVIANNGSKWTFRALDGAGEITWGGVIATPPVVTGTGRLPTLANLTDGTWDQQGVISINIPNRTTGNKLALMNDFLVQAKSPALLAAQTGLKFAAASLVGTPDPSATGNVTRAGYSGGDQCAPLNRNN